MSGTQDQEQEQAAAIAMIDEIKENVDSVKYALGGYATMAVAMPLVMRAWPEKRVKVAQGALVISAVLAVLMASVLFHVRQALESLWQLSAVGAIFLVILYMALPITMTYALGVTAKTSNSPVLVSTGIAGMLTSLIVLVEGTVERAFCIGTACGSGCTASNAGATYGGLCVPLNDEQVAALYRDLDDGEKDDLGTIPGDKLNEYFPRYGVTDAFTPPELRDAWQNVSNLDLDSTASDEDVFKFNLNRLAYELNTVAMKEELFKPPPAIDLVYYPFGGLVGGIALSFVAWHFAPPLAPAPAPAR